MRMEDAKIANELTMELDVWWVHLLLEASGVHSPMAGRGKKIAECQGEWRSHERNLPNSDIQLELMWVIYYFWF